jgi:UDP-N-acetylmuramate--alanine ligase
MAPQHRTGLLHPRARPACHDRAIAPLAIDLSTPRRVHVVGVGGAGMSAIALVLRAMGHAVSGSDAVDGPVLDRLRAAGVAVGVGSDPARIDGVDAVAASTAVPADDPEVAAARAAGIVVLRRAEALAAMCAARPTIAVAGTHGKTTTTAMLALVLREAGLAPSFIVGGHVPGLGGGAAWDVDGDGCFVVEADESDGTFLELAAESAILTSVEPDHLEHWGSGEALAAAFTRFLANAERLRVVCADDPGARAAAAGLTCTTYGTADDADERIVDLALGSDGVAFTLVGDGHPPLDLEVPLPGVHNARNAAAAAAAALALGAAPDAIAPGLARVQVARRWEHRGEAAGVTFIDDYAHLPGEVAPALAAAKAGPWRRVVCAFQPHRSTRTQALAPQFGPVFADADVLAVTDIYLPAGQQPLPGVTGKLVVDAVLDTDPTRRVAWLPRRSDLLTFLTLELRPGDLCLTLGAGDVTSLPDEVRTALETRPPRR